MVVTLMSFLTPLNATASVATTLHSNYKTGDSKTYKVIEDTKIPVAGVYSITNSTLITVKITKFIAGPYGVVNYTVSLDNTTASYSLYKNYPPKINFLYFGSPISYFNPNSWYPKTTATYKSSSYVWYSVATQPLVQYNRSDLISTEYLTASYDVHNGWLQSFNYSSNTYYPGNGTTFYNITRSLLLEQVSKTNSFPLVSLTFTDFIPVMATLSILIVIKRHKS